MKPEGQIRLELKINATENITKEQQDTIIHVFKDAAIDRPYNVSDIKFNKSLVRFELYYKINFNPVLVINTLKTESSRALGLKRKFWKASYVYRSLAPWKEPGDFLG